MERQYFHEAIGGNFRLDELQAAILSVKLPRLNKWSARRRAAADFYRDEFSRVGLLEKIRLPEEPFRGRELLNSHIFHAGSRSVT
jgi:Predicted pyridoxal phosphate-dependent enzyme apparently involved in regulation of cell wall biogenesis